MIRSTLEIPSGQLRPLRPDDAADIARACSDPEIGRWTQVPHPYRIDNAQVFIESGGGEDHVWAIDVDGLVGVIGIRGTQEAMPGPITEVGYWVAPWARGRGVATEALTAVREELQSAGYQRINWQAVAGNEASIRVAQKAGFTIEGYRRQGMVQHGQLVDSVVGGWTREHDEPELVAGAWQVQPVEPVDFPEELMPQASTAVAVWVARTAVGGDDTGYVLAVRSPLGLHVVGHGAPEPAVAAAIRYLSAQGWSVTEEPLPPVSG